MVAAENKVTAAIRFSAGGKVGFLELVPVQLSPWQSLALYHGRATISATLAYLKTKVAISILTATDYSNSEICCDLKNNVAKEKGLAIRCALSPNNVSLGI
jgi:hypothetical protein